jgi:transposase
MPTIRRPSPDEDRAARQARRMRAAELFARGRSQAEVARELGVSRESARRWHERWRTGGADALQSRGRTGPDPKLADAQLPGIEQALLEGAKAAGFANDLWTLERIAVVIERLTGVRLPAGSVWRLLHQRLGWSVQRPERRARERDDEAIQRWVAHEWRLKKGRATARHGSSSSTNPPSP